jgi:hypothetical protein
MNDENSTDISVAQQEEIMKQIRRCKNYKKAACFRLKKEIQEKKKRDEEIKGVGDNSTTPFADLIRLLPDLDEPGIMRKV